MEKVAKLQSRKVLRELWRQAPAANCQLYLPTPYFEIVRSYQDQVEWPYE